MKRWYVGKSMIAGYGAFTLQPIQKGESIDIGINYFRSHRSNTRYPYVTDFGSQINHCWNPNSNVKYEPNDGRYYVRASKYLPADTEITVDYRKMPEFIEGPMEWYV